ncbi:MbcA/ParS/Xre antitoxin family protein [Oleisolibacter albus]|uniref:MbcA/ParS/Xre antitoxin family protein n=1 Tax=Oleisolibacter albus TaxID=2171757 RepID=UPI000DF35011|nr:MbcA/ParS/Xre antitoxin family protein [Oleisolibacter albus]
MNRQERVLSTAVVRAADLLDLSNTELAAILGLSEASISRLRRGSFRLQRGSKPFELGQILVRLFRSLDSITGGDDAASNSWLRSHNLALDAVPLERLRSVTGLVDTVAYLDARRGWL